MSAMSYQMDDKLPHFLVKLWSILTDDSLSDIIRWDPVSALCKICLYLFSML